MLSSFRRMFLRFWSSPHRWSFVLIAGMITLLFYSMAQWAFSSVRWGWFFLVFLSIFPALLHYWWKPRFWPPVFLYATIVGFFFSSAGWWAFGESFLSVVSFFITMSGFGLGYSVIVGLLFRRIFRKEYADYTLLYWNSAAGKAYGAVLGVLVVAMSVFSFLYVDESHVFSGVTWVDTPEKMRVGAVLSACFGLYVIGASLLSKDFFDSESWSMHAADCRQKWTNSSFQQNLLERCGYQIDIAQVLYKRYGEASLQKVAEDERQFLPEGGVKENPDLYRIHLWKTRSRISSVLKDSGV